MIPVYIGLGSNLSRPEKQLEAAKVALSALPNSKLVSCSNLYRSAPMGPQDQPDYVNAVLRLDTMLEPLELLTHTQEIELTQGRVRKDERWGPRTLDLDILLFGQNIIELPNLVIPHYGMKQREFVLYPLFEISPDLVLPDGTPLTDLLELCPLNGLQVIDSVSC